VPDAIHDFNDRGLDALIPSASRPKGIQAVFDENRAEQLREMLHRSPREFGRDSSLWTLHMAAQVAFDEGLVQRPVSGETIRATLARLLGVRWQRAKRWINSPDPLYERKRRRDRLMEVAAADSEWAVGFEEECWWSRLALPTLRAAGPKRESLCASFRSGSLKTIPIRKLSPATGSTSAGARSNVVAFRGWPAR
jgi:hypothetical protein